MKTDVQRRVIIDKCKIIIETRSKPTSSCDLTSTYVLMKELHMRKIKIVKNKAIVWMKNVEIVEMYLRSMAIVNMNINMQAIHATVER